MKIVDYLKDKSLYLAVNLMTFIIVATLMYFSNVSTVVIFMTWCIWFLPLLIYIIIEYIKYKKYFDNIKDVLKNLDKKYLLPEVIDKRWLSAFMMLLHRCFCDKFIIRSEIKCFSCVQ